MKLVRPVAPAVLSDAVPLVVSRQLLQQFTQDIKLKLPHDAHKEVATLCVISSFISPCTTSPYYLFLQCGAI